MRRSDPAQLDFFATLDRQSAEVVPFPADRMIGAMRDIAAELLALPAKSDRDRRYGEDVSRLRQHLRSLRLAPDEIDRQMQAFRTGVACEARKQVILSILWTERGDAA